MADDASRALAIASMVLASRDNANDGSFNGDPQFVRRVAYLNSSPNFNLLINCGFLECASGNITNDSKPLASCNTEERRDRDRDRDRGEERRGEEKPRAVARRAERLPPDLDLPYEWINEAKKIRSDWTNEKVETVFAEFRDYWTAKSGKDATKVDWAATWRNWCRREKSFARNQQQYLTPGQRKLAVTDASIAEFLSDTPKEKTIDGVIVND